MRIGLFVYNFPHKKTQDFLLRLFLEGYDVEAVLGCDPVDLRLPQSVLRVKPKHTDMLHPKVICERLRIPYFETPHNSQGTIDLIKLSHLHIGVIAGARILKEPVINAFSRGVINFHPGLIPEVRGIDALKWAIYKNLPIGVTAHFIDERTDAGRIICREEVPLYADDTLIDVSLRQYEAQVNLLPRVLRLIEQVADFPLVTNLTKPNSPMPNELEKEIPLRFADRLKLCKS